MYNFIIQLLALSSINSLGAGETLTQFHVNDTYLQQFQGFPCPNPTDIAPCACIYDSDSARLTLNCTDISSNEELADILAKEFPVNEFYEFTMRSSSALTALNFTCGGVKFRRFYLAPGPFPLLEVSDAFYESCSSLDLEYVKLYDTQLSTLVFPPPPLSDKITNFHMRNSNLASVPSISSASLSSLYLVGSQISQTTAGTFDGIPSLNELNLEYNNIKILENGSIPITNDGSWYEFYGNEMEKIEPGAFYLKEEPTLDSVVIVLFDNLLKTIDSSVFELLMPYVYALYIFDNPLDCGCDLAWIILNPEYMKKVTYYAPTCTDGTLLVALDPTPYEQFC